MYRGFRLQGRKVQFILLDSGHLVTKRAALVGIRNRLAADRRSSAHDPCGGLRGPDVISTGSTLLFRRLLHLLFRSFAALLGEFYEPQALAGILSFTVIARGLAG